MERKCQKCDGDLRRPAGADSSWRPDEWDNELGGHFSYQGAYGSTRYDFELWKAELCESCCEDLRSWIDRGPGEGVTVVDTLDIAGKAAGDEPIPGPGLPEHRGFMKRYKSMLKKHGIRKPY